MIAAALLIVLGPKGGMADRFEVTEPLFLVAYIAVDAIPACPSTLFLPTTPPVKIVRHASNEVFLPTVFSAVADMSADLVQSRTPRTPFPFVVYSLSRTAHSLALAHSS
jgi:hypothetical protein